MRHTTSRADLLVPGIATTTNTRSRNPIAIAVAFALLMAAGGADAASELGSDQTSNPNIHLAQATTRFNLPAQPLADSLRAVAGQTNSNILFDRNLVEGITAKPLQAELSVGAALTELLKGTELVYRSVDDKTVMIVARQRTSETGMIEKADGLRLAQNDSPVTASESRSSSAIEREQKSMTTLEEVVVTAQKREQRLQDVPVSVAVVSGGELLARNENEIRALEKFDPSFRFTERGAQGANSMQIRGVGTQTINRVDQSVGVVIDGVSASSVEAALADLNDVARIEVLRGPQGMLFGKNASAGLVNIVTNRPTREAEFGAGVSYGSENEILGNGFASGPLAGDEWLGRISFYRNTRDGFIENILPGGVDLGKRDEWGARGKLEWIPNDSFDALLTMSHVDRRNTYATGFLAPPITLDPGGIPEQEGLPSGAKNDKIKATGNLLDVTDMENYSLELNYHFGKEQGSTLTSLTGFSNGDFLGRQTDAGVGSRLLLPSCCGDTHIEQWTQELRLTSPAGELFEYVAGLYYLYNEFDSFSPFKLDLYGVGAAPAPGLLGLSIPKTFDTSYESAAAFASVTWNLSDQFRLTAGARYQQDTLEQHMCAFDDPGAFVVTLPNTPVGCRDASKDDGALSWRFIGEYDLSDDAMVYASVARGYKGPGPLTVTQFISAPEPIVDPEIPTAYEVGLKSEWWDRRLRLNGALFYTKFEDFQAEALDLSQVIGQFFLTNAGVLETQGVELALEAQLTDAFRFTSAATYQEAEFKEFHEAPCYAGQSAALGCVGGVQDLSGTALPNAPKLTYTLTGRYEVPLQSIDYSAYALGSWVWRDRHNTAAGNDPATVTDSYGLADLFVGLKSNDGRYAVQFFVKNLFDQFYETMLQGSNAGITSSHLLAYDYKRRYGVSAQVRF